MTDTIAETADREFLPKRSVGIQAAAAIGGGVLIVLFGVLMFVIGLSLPAGKDTMMPGLIGGVSAGAFLLIYHGVSLLRAPVRVRLDPRGVHFVGRLSEQHLPWQSIARISREKRTQIGGKVCDVLKLYDDNDRPIAEIRDVFQDFAALVAAVQARSSAARGVSTYNRDSERLQKIVKQKKAVRVRALLCGLICLIGAAGVCWGVVALVHQRQLDSQGVVTDAQLTRRHVERVTPYIEYAFRDAAGQIHTRDAMVDQQTYDALEGAAVVSVRYVPSSPDWNRLVSGDTEPAPAWTLVLAGGAILVMFGGMLVMMALGYADLRLKDGKLVLKRIGDVEDELQPAAATSAAATAPPAAAVMLATPPIPQAPAGGSGMSVLGVLNISIGLLGLVCNGGRLATIMILSGRTFDLGPNQLQVQGSAEIYATFAVDMLLALLLAVAGIGLLIRRRWGRTLSIVIAALQIISTIIALVLLVRQFGSPGQDVDLQTRSRELTRQAGAVAGMVISVIYPVVLLILLLRPSLRHWPSSQSTASSSLS